MQQHVGDLVGQGADRVGRAKAGVHPDAPVRPGRRARSPAAVAAPRAKAVRRGQGDQRVPGSGRHLPGRQPLRRTGGRRSPGGLGDVPHVAEPGARREDLDAALPLADLPPGRLPRLVSGDHGGAGALRRDQQDGGEVLAGHACGGAQPAGPVLAGAQRSYLGVQSILQRGELALVRVAAGCGFPFGRRVGGHGDPSGGCRPQALASQRRRSLAIRWPCARTPRASAAWVSRTPRRSASAMTLLAASTSSPSGV